MHVPTAPRRTPSAAHAPHAFPSGSSSPQTRVDEGLARAGRSFPSCASSERACRGGHRCLGQAQGSRGKALPRGGQDGERSRGRVSHGPRSSISPSPADAEVTLSDTYVTLSDARSSSNKDTLAVACLIPSTAELAQSSGRKNDALWWALTPQQDTGFQHCEWH